MKSEHRFVYFQDPFLLFWFFSGLEKPGRSPCCCALNLALPVYFHFCQNLAWFCHPMTIHHSNHRCHHKCLICRPASASPLIHPINYFQLGTNLVPGLSSAVSLHFVIFIIRLLSSFHHRQLLIYTIHSHFIGSAGAQEMRLIKVAKNRSWPKRAKHAWPGSMYILR